MSDDELLAAGFRPPRTGRLFICGLRGGILALPPGETQERDLSWLDFSYAADVSADGRQLLIGDIGGGLGGRGGVPTNVVRHPGGASNIRP